MTVSGVAAPFGQLAAEVWHTRLADHDLDREVDAAVDHVLEGMAALSVHSDVPDELRALAALPVVTLSNGATQVAEALPERSGVRTLFDRLLPVKDTGI